MINIGFSVFFTGPILIYVSVMISMNKGKGTVAAKLFQLGIIILLISAGIQILFVGDITIGEVYQNGINLKGGGLSGIVLGWLLLLFGRTAASVLVILIAFIAIMLASDITLHEFLRIIAFPFRKLGSAIKEKGRQYREDSEYLRMLNEENRKLDKIAAAKNDSEPEIDINKAIKFASIEAAAGSGRSQSESDIPQTDIHKDYQKELTAYISGAPAHPNPQELREPDETPKPEKEETAETKEQ